MVPKTRAVTAKALQSLLIRIGAASSGTKASLEERLRRDITRPRLFTRRPEWESSRPADEKLRVISIDMGIKNLAFCEAEVSYPVQGSLNAAMEILRWEKVDLTPATRDTETPNALPNAIGLGDADEDSDPFSLNVLSKTAYEFVKKTVLSETPDVILIEKQRWRSGGGSAVQQWTLRVNTLEGMLWAVLKTVYAERLATLEKGTGFNHEKDKGLYDVFGVDPKRVGHYWLGQSAQHLAAEEETLSPVADVLVEAEGRGSPKLSRSKAEKKAKISLLRTWLTTSPTSTASTTASTTPTISFKIGKNAESTYQALCFPTKPIRNKKAKRSPEASLDRASDDMSAVQMKKLDDVTDCFLQAAAWVSWESNRVQLRDIWRKQGMDTQARHDGGFPELNNSVILEMLKEVEG